MEITLEDFIDNQEFDKNEIVITVIGKRAINRTNYIWPPGNPI